MSCWGMPLKDIVRADYAAAGAVMGRGVARDISAGGQVIRALCQPVLLMYGTLELEAGVAR
jgi:hypothetical protein